MATQNTQKKRRMEALGANIALLRKNAGMSKQEDLARVAGVGVRTISDIETGKKVPRVSTMRKLEAALDLEPGDTDDFLDGKISKLMPHSSPDDTGPGGLRERRLRDEVEEAMMGVRAAPEHERWEAIFERRARIAHDKGTTDHERQRRYG